MSGLDVSFVQDNHSFSIHRGTLRGLHFQYPPKAQDKLVRCSQGAIFDIAVDIRIVLQHMADGLERNYQKKMANNYLYLKVFFMGL